MQAGQVIDPEIGEHHDQKADNGQKGDTLSMPSAHEPGMEQGGINKPGDE